MQIPSCMWEEQENDTHPINQVIPTRVQTRGGIPKFWLAPDLCLGFGAGVHDEANLKVNIFRRSSAFEWTGRWTDLRSFNERID